MSPPFRPPIPVASAIYLVATGIIAAVGWGYESAGPGLAAPGAGGPFYCNRLQSSGGEDSVMVSMLAVFVVPFLFRLMRPHQPAGRIEVGVFSFSTLCVLAALWLASLDCADIFYTAFGIPDLQLAAALVALPLSATALWVLRRAAGQA